MSPSLLASSYALLVFVSRMRPEGFTRTGTSGMKGEVTGARVLLSTPFPDTGTGDRLCGRLPESGFGRHVALGISVLAPSLFSTIEVENRGKLPVCILSGGKGVVSAQSVEAQGARLP
jgi:hypothetical protein